MLIFPGPFPWEFVAVYDLDPTAWNNQITGEDDEVGGPREGGGRDDNRFQLGIEGDPAQCLGEGLFAF